MNYPYFKKIADTLQSLNKPGSHATGGMWPLPLPSLSITGMTDLIGLPLCTAQARELSLIATQAPFGRGEETIVDTSVRHTKQLDPHQFIIKNTKWNVQLNGLMSHIGEELGCGKDGVKLDLYKLLLYEPGGFFKAHRDTIKSPGMFGTLIIQLPCNYTGGKLSVTHLKKKLEFEFGGEEGSTEFHYVAFYADCLHEVEPVVDGYRICLVYNLIWNGIIDQIPHPPDTQHIINIIASCMKEWNESKCQDKSDPPRMMTYFLDHQYTRSDLSFNNLKSSDRSVAKILTEAAKFANFEIHLSLVDVRQEWSADDCCYYEYKRYRYDDTPEANELMEEDATIDCLVTVDNLSFNVSLSLDEETFVPREISDKFEPNDSEYSPSGNEGATIDKQYSIAALLMWPFNNRFENISLGNFVSMIKSKIDIPNLKKEEKDNLKVMAQSLVTHLQVRSNTVDATKLLKCLMALGFPIAVIKDALSLHCLSLSGATSELMNVLSSIASTYGWTTILPHLRAMIAISSIDKTSKLVSLLSSIVPLSEELHSVCAPLVTDVIDKIMNTRSQYTKEILCYLFKSLSSIRYENTSQLMEYITCNPDRFPLHTTLIPTVQELCTNTTQDISGPVKHVLIYCISQLETRLSRSMSPPPSSWTFPDTINCLCEDCKKVKQFLQDPGKRLFHLAVAEKRRRHVQSQLFSNKSINTSIQRTGSPFTLVVTKRHMLSNRPEHQKLCTSLKMLLAGGRQQSTTSTDVILIE